MTDDKLVLRFEDPPPAKRGPTAPGVREFRKALMKHPMRWAIYSRDLRQFNRSDICKKYPEMLDCEFVTRRNKGDDGKWNGTVTVYGRYVGEGKERRVLEAADGPIRPLFDEFRYGKGYVIPNSTTNNSTVSVTARSLDESREERDSDKFRTDL